MNHLLMVKNISREGPGLLENVLHETNINFDLVDLDKGDRLPDPTDYKAVVILGGPDSANDTTQKMAEELKTIKVLLKTGTPYLGICLGLQTLVKAAGGKVVPGEQKEVGFLDPKGKQNTIQLTGAGEKDPLFKGLADNLPVFQLHGETVELIDAMELLATGEYCSNQVVKVSDRAYGIQSHFELTPDMLAVWAEQDPDLIPLGKAKLLGDFVSIQQAYAQTGKTLLRNFLSVAGLI